MQESRKIKTIRNLIYAWLSQGFTITMNIIVRIIFVHILSKEYLGITGLFSNIITILSVAELGVGSAIVYGLYEPLAKNDQKHIKALMQFYQKIYTGIGIFILIAGFALTPYISWFIKELPDIPHLQFIYLLFICNTAASYFFSYKGTLISADQKEYMLKKIRIKVLFSMYIAQIIILLITKNYIAFLLVQVISTIIINFGYSLAADHMYPFLKDKYKIRLDPPQLQQIVKNTKALFCHKIGSVAVFSTDNLILSKYTGLDNVADYSNYILIQETLNGILTQLFSAMSASIGNLIAIEDKQTSLNTFWKIMFLDSWLYGNCTICFLCLAQDFIRLCFGENYLVSTNILIIIIINFYLTGIRKCVITFKDAYGLFSQNWYMPLLEAIINLLVSIGLVLKFGVIGVLIGTTISSLLVPVWSEPYILFHYGFQQTVIDYWKQNSKYLSLLIFSAIIAWYISSLIPYIPVVSFLLKGICCLSITNITFYLVLRKEQNMKYFLNLYKIFEKFTLINFK